MIPVAGSAYTYAYTTLGEWLAWIIGWDLVLEYAVGAATVSISWSGYVVSFLSDFGIHLPPQLLAGPFEPSCCRMAGRSMVSSTCRLSSSWSCISLLLMTGHQESARAQCGIVVVSSWRWCWCSSASGGRTSTSQLHAVHSREHRRVRPFGLSGIMAGAGTIFFAYIGFDAVSTAAQEAKNPQSDMPIGIIGSLVDMHDSVHPVLRTC